MDLIKPKQIEHIADWQQNLDRAFEQLEDIDFHQQQNGIETLLEFHHRYKNSPPVLDTLFASRRSDCEAQLLKLAESPNKFVASASMNLLVQIESTLGFETALLYLDSQNPHLREGAVGLFGLGAPDAELARLDPFLNDRSPRVRHAAIKALGLRGRKECLPQLLNMLNDTSAELRSHFGLKNVRGGQIRQLLKAIARMDGTAAVPLLVEIATKDVGMRSYAVSALSEIDAHATAPAVAHLLTDKSTTLQAHVLRLVHRADYRAALPLVRPLLNSTDSVVRSHAFQIVADWNDQASFDWLCRMVVSETNPVLRCNIVRGLGRLAGPKAEEPLVALLSDLNVQVRVAVIQSLATLPVLAESTRYVLQSLAQSDADTQVRNAAAHLIIPVNSLEAQMEMDDAHSGVGPPLLLPPDLISAAKPTLLFLEQWRENIPLLAGTCQVEIISQLDHALSTLIQAILDADEQINLDEQPNEGLRPSVEHPEIE